MMGVALMRKIIAIGVVLVLTLFLAACGRGNADERTHAILEWRHGISLEYSAHWRFRDDGTLYIFPQGRPYRATWYYRTAFILDSWPLIPQHAYGIIIDPDEWLESSLNDEYTNSRYIDGVQAFYQHRTHDQANRTMHPYARSAMYSFIHGDRLFAVMMRSGDDCLDEWAVMQDILESIRLQHNNGLPPAIALDEFYYDLADMYKEEWQKAYATLLRNYALKPPSHGFDYLSRSFILHDINQDGIPELIITYAAAGIWGESIYTFIDGDVVPLEFRDSFFAYNDIIAPRDNQAGIVIAAYGLVRLMQIDETGIFAEISLQSPFLPFDDDKWFINDREVSEEEHDAMLNIIIDDWPQWSDSSRLWPYELTEENIQNVILQIPYS